MAFLRHLGRLAASLFHVRCIAGSPGPQEPGYFVGGSAMRKALVFALALLAADGSESSIKAE
jgi:hypothetical protein